MSTFARTFASAAALVVCSAVAAAQATVDPAIVGFKLPDQMVWKDNPSGNRTAVLQGDPSKPGPYAVLLQWLPGKMSRPHFHPNDRFFIVVSGTWWVGSGPEFKPDATVPMPAGSHVIHYAKGVHFDGEGRAGHHTRLGRRACNDHTVRHAAGEIVPRTNRPSAGLHGSA